MKTKFKKRESKYIKSQDRAYEGYKIWISFWRKNIHRFCMDYLNVELFPFQMILLLMMEKYNFFLFIASRGRLNLPHYIEIYS